MSEKMTTEMAVTRLRMAAEAFDAMCMWLVAKELLKVVDFVESQDATIAAKDAEIKRLRGFVNVVRDVVSNEGFTDRRDWYRRTSELLGQVDDMSESEASDE